MSRLRAAAAGSTARAPLSLHLRRPQLPGLRRRHAGLGAARQRRPSGRPQLQVPPAARDHDRRRRGAERAGPARAAGGRSEPNLRATEIELYDGLDGREPEPLAVARLRRRRGRPTCCRRFLPAGFYYKTFLWPAAWWQSVYEPFIRRAAGLGRAPTRPDPDRYLHRHAHCDVLVVGGGPAGLMAALAAGRSGARVILAERERRARRLAAERERHAGRLRRTRRRCLAAASRGRARRPCPRSRSCGRTTAFGYLDHNYLALLERVADHLPLPPPNQPRQRLWRVRAKQVVLATGAIERPLVFHGNDRPGVMLASAARTYLNRFAVRPGERVGRVHQQRQRLCGRARSARRAGVDDRGDRRPAAATPTARCRAAAAAAGLPIRRGSAVVGTDGRLRISRVVGVADCSRRQPRRRASPRRCAATACSISGGWNPTVHLFSQSRGKLRFDDDAGRVRARASRCSRSARPVPANGSFALAACFAEGAQAGAEAARAAGFSAADAAPCRRCASPRRRRCCRPGPCRATSPVARQGVRRLPERRHRQGSRPGRARGLPVDRARQALHHHRHGHRPGQDQQRQRAGDRGRQARHPDRGRRHHHLPHALHAGDLRRPGRPARRRAVRPDPPHAEPRLGDGAGRGVRGCRQLEARPLLPAARRGHARRRRSASAGPCAQGVGLFDASTLGKIDLQGPDAPSSSTASTPTPGPSSRSAAAATA